jgi:iron complex transport system substrate-binding protein
MRHRLSILVLALAAAVTAGCRPAAPPAGPAMRILSLTPNVTEILFAMGLGDSLVGRSAYCTYPPEAQALPAVGDTTKLNLEEIVRLQPTLAFLVTRRQETVGRLEGLGIRTVPLACDHMDELFEAVRTLGRETGRPEAAEALLARIESGLAGVRARVRGLGRPKVLFAIPMTVGSARTIVAGRGTFVDELLDVAGADNAYPDTADWPMVGPQQIIALAPDVVIVNAVDDIGPADRLGAIRQAWQSLAGVPAVARGRVHILTEAHLTIPGPRIADAARLLAEAIHPDLPPEARP